MSTKFDPSEEIALNYWARNNEKSYAEIVDRVVGYLFKDSSSVVQNDMRALLLSKTFMPNSPVFMNAGTGLKSLAACFVLPVEDSMESIFDCARNMAMVMKEGGGVGISLSKLRPEGTAVKTTKGASSGPVSFLEVYDSVVMAVKQGGTRRGAALANLRVDHPDVLKFIRCKEQEGKITNFNISVALTDEFMRALKNKTPFRLYHEKSPAPQTVDPQIIWRAIINGMWRNGEPGVQFIDRVNRTGPYTEKYQKFNTGIETSNPCSEAFLRPFESCVLGAINLYNFVTPFWEKSGPNFNKVKFEEAVAMAVTFLNKVIDVSEAPLDAINKNTRESRKIGIGVLGLADTLSAMGMPYNSEIGRSFANHIFAALNAVAIAESEAKRHNNAMLTLVAPTGTTGLVANVSQGIEPHFRILFNRNSQKIGQFKMMCRSFSDFYLSEGHTDEETKTMMAEVEKNGGKLPAEFPLKTIEGKLIPMKDIWPTADEISPMDHIKMLEVTQRHVHNGVSKTINLPNSATEKDIENAVIYAWEHGIKGITVYRDGSRNEQVISEIKTSKEKEPARAPDSPKDEEKRERPTVTYGASTKVKIGCGNLYITTNRDDHGPCEVFTNLGRAGGCPSQSEATARLISLCLRSGVPVDEVTDQLVGIRCMSTIASQKTGKMPDGKRVLSCPDAIGKALQMFSEDSKTSTENAEPAQREVSYVTHVFGSKTDNISDKQTPSLLNGIAQVMPLSDGGFKGNAENATTEALKCPKCSIALQREGRCGVCPNCGYSKCG